MLPISIGSIVVKPVCHCYHKRRIYHILYCNTPWLKWRMWELNFMPKIFVKHCFVICNKLSHIYFKLTHWGRVTHVCVSNLVIIGSDKGLSSCRRQAIIWTNAGILLIRTSGTNLSEILSEINTFSSKDMHLKISSGKCQTFCLGLNVLMKTSCHFNATQWHGIQFCALEWIVHIMKYIYWTMTSVTFETFWTKEMHPRRHIICNDGCFWNKWLL